MYNFEIQNKNQTHLVAWFKNFWLYYFKYLKKLKYMYFFNFVSWCTFFVDWYWNFGSCNHFVLFHVLPHVLCISTGMIQLLQTIKIDGTNRHARSTLTVHNTDQLWVCHAFTRRKRAIMWARLLLIGMWGSLRS